MKKFGLFFGLLLGGLLLASQALAATVYPVSAFYLPPSPDADGYYQMRWRQSPTAGVTYTLEESFNDPTFAATTVAYSGTASYTYIGTPVKKVAGSYYYRITATLGADSSTATEALTPIVVPELALQKVNKPNALRFPATDADGKFRVIIGKSMTSGASYELEQCTSSDFTIGCEPIISTGALTYADIQIAATGTYYFRARAIKLLMQPSDWFVAEKVTSVGPPVVKEPIACVVSIPASPVGSVTFAADYAGQKTAWDGSRHANADMAPNLNQTSGCNKCHNPTKEVATQIGCEGCHTAGAAPDTTVVAAANSCAKCHTNNHYSVGNHMRLAANANCMECHDSHTLEILESATRSLAPTAGKVLSAANVAVSANAGNLVVEFDILDGATPVTGATGARIYAAGLEAGAALSGDADQWKYWGAYTSTTAETPVGSGHYVITLTGKTIAQALGSVAKQRAIVRISVPTGAGIFEYPRIDFDLTDPAAPAAIPLAGKDVVNDDACKECHGYGVAIHGYSRNNTKTCVVCHSPNYSANMTTHKSDLTSLVHQIHSGNAVYWAEFNVNSYPDTMLNCTKCHNTVANANNFNDKPSMVACTSCHDTLTFDGNAYTGIKGTLKIGHFVTTNNQFCSGCHSLGPLAASLKHVNPNAAALRTVVATITGTPVVDVDGGVTVNFSVTEGVAAKTNLTAASFTLAKLVPAAAGAPSYWESYLMKMRTKTANFPVTQAQAEAQTDGTFTNLGAGNYSYKFGFKNGSTLGDIRTISKVGTRMAAAYALNEGYNSTNLPSMIYPVAYEPNLTHRLGISISGNKKEAFIDFVPAGGVAETRNIVSWDTACVKCHGDKRIHSGYSIERCTGCHTKNTFDPYSSTSAPVLTSSMDAMAKGQTVEIGYLVHRVHMGKDLPSALAGTPYMINGENFSIGGTSAAAGNKATSKADPSDCKICHDETNVAMADAANWRTPSVACGSCHDSQSTLNHVNADGTTCVTCHTTGAGKVGSVEESHYGK